MDINSLPSLPRSLAILTKECSELYRQDRCVFACENPIFVDRRGDVYDGRAQIFLLPYDVHPAFSCHYLWEELHCIKRNKAAKRYSEEELLKLRAYLGTMATEVGLIPMISIASCTQILKELKLIH